MFKRVEAPAGRRLAFSFEGQPMQALEGDTVAAALTAAGMRDFRSTPVSGAARGPYCMMGVCYDCLVEIDGVPNRQACMVPLAEGMVVRRQGGAPEVESA